MNFLNIDKIGIAKNRQRRDFDPASLNELRESIATNGLFHPLVVREESGQFFLVAGERRLRAIKDLYDLNETLSFNNEPVRDLCVPCVTLGELSDLEREEAELDENIRRDDLTWQERAAATARLANLRRSQAVAADLPEPTHLDIAAEVRGSAEGRAREAVRRELIVARHLDNPEVASAKTMDDAFKILKAAESRTKNTELAERVGLTFGAHSHKLYNEGCIPWMKGHIGLSYDCILTDPPYGMGADEFGDGGGVAAGAHAYKDDFDTFKYLMEPFAAESFRLAKETAHAYIFCDIDNFPLIRNWMNQAGWRVHRTPIIWVKPNGSRIPWPNIGPQRKYELCLYAVKGARPSITIAPDIVTFPTDSVNLGHAAQKPVDLFRELLKRTCRPGDSVLDPFCGTGTIFPAAHDLKILATGIELDAASYGIAVKRLGELK